MVETEAERTLASYCRLHSTAVSADAGFGVKLSLNYNHFL